MTSTLIAPTEYDLPALTRITRDLKKAASTLSLDEVRYLVNTYYDVQHFRIQSNIRVMQFTKNGIPHEMLNFFGDQFEMIENNIKSALDAYTKKSGPKGEWLRSICGIGPVIAAGFLAFLGNDIDHAPTVGHWWRYAGMDPTDSWGKGEKCPWNKRLKVLCYKAGESFVKVQSNENDVYGKIYAARKLLEIERNEKGLFADQAAAAMKRFKFGEDTNALAVYKTGKLPAAHLHARARRYAVKLFVAHFHHVVYEVEKGTPPPKPYILAHGEHTHYIAPPNWPLIIK
jgi:hypothetical protein